MSYESPQTTISAQLAAADLSAKQFCFAKATSSGVNIAGNGDVATLGIIQNNPASGLPVTLYGVGSISKLVLGTGGATQGASLASDVNGHGIVATTGLAKNAIALEAGSAGDVIAVLIGFHGTA